VADNAFSCVAWNSTLEVLVSYTNSKQNITIQRSQAWNPISLSPPPVPLPDPSRDVMSAVVNAVYSSLQGYLTSQPLAQPTNMSRISLSELVDSSGPVYAFNNVQDGIQEIMLGSSLSLMPLASEKISPSLLALTRCSQSNIFLVYNYNPLLLILSYGVALGVGIICVSIGYHALFGVNGGIIAHDRFSAILLATRNKTFDSVLTSKGEREAESELKKMSLRYGHLMDGHLAFGVRGDFSL